MISMKLARYSGQLFFAAAVALGLSGCGGGGGGGPSGPTIDMTGVSGAGSLSNPYVIPANNQTGLTYGLGEYFNQGGVWRLNLDGQVQTTGYGSAGQVGALLYDADYDQWRVTVEASTYVLSNDGTGYFLSATCTIDSCVDFLPYDDSVATAQYGSFGYVYFEDTTRIVEYFVHTGLKTQAGDMPTGGVGIYTGAFLGVVNSVIGDDYVSGNADIVADFTSGSASLTFDSIGAGTFGTYSLAGGAVISGNTYSGTVSGAYTDGISTVAFDAAGSTLSGAFYGPFVEETAGVVYASSANGEIAGGFWAIRP